MKKLIPALILLCVSLTFFACLNLSENTPPDPYYIQGVTKGELSVYDNIIVVFTDAIKTDDINISASPFHFKPDIEGDISWVDDYTITFNPKVPLKEGTEYRMTFSPASIGRTDIADFNINLKTIEQECIFKNSNLVQNTDTGSDEFKLISMISTADLIEKDQLSDSLLVELDGQEIPFELFGDELDSSYKLITGKIQKNGKISKLNVSVRKSSIKNSNSLAIDIPARDDFILLNEQPKIDSEGVIELFFSELIDQTQNLHGLVQVKDVEGLQLKMTGNSIKLFTNGKWPLKTIIKVNNTIQNIDKNQLSKDYDILIKMPTEKPMVRFIGDGSILPTTQGTTIPIETMNLNSVMIEAVKIHGENMTQFLQVNDLDGDKEIYRVGEVVWQKIVDLSWSDDNVDEWVKYGLDISPLMKLEPEGVIQLRLTFRYPHIEYPRSNSSMNEEMVEFLSIVPEPEADSSSWDNWEQNNSYSYKRERFNPCHPAYYQKYSDHNISVSKNVIVSDIGIIARKSTDNKLHVALSDLKSLKPLSNSSISIFNFQNKIINTAVADRNGQAIIDLKEKTPFYIKANSNKQVGYLKIDDGNAISISHFSVGGVTPQKGVQGFIYGERDIWRPGDTLHMTMILSDPENSIPKEHPVTAELYDPFGKKLLQQQIENVSNFYYVPFETRSDFPTGTYSIKFHVGAIEFEKNLRIETIVPNRLKIDLSFDDQEDYFSNGLVSGIISSKWLHGAIAGNLKADVKMNVNPIPTVFSDYKEYQFDDETRNFSSKTETLFAGNLDSQGVSDFSKNVNIQGAPGELQARLTTRVFEPGGGFSTEYTNRRFHPYDQYVGIKLPKGDIARGMLLTDTDHKVDIVLVDKDGNSVKSGSVTAEFYKIQWRWWWETDSENLAGFTSRQSTKKLKSEKVEIVNGKGQWSFRINYPDWGRYYIRVVDNSSGHSTGKIQYIDWPGWAGRAQDEGTQGVSMLMLNADKSRYNVGDTIKVNIPGNKDGKCFISIENGGRILKSEWVSFSSDSIDYQFMATADMAPNIYVHATFLQPHLQTLNDRPIRSYGVIPVMVENPSSQLNPVITTSETFKPGSAVRINVSERNGKDMTYTLAIVDEGLLGLTKFQTPNPWLHFFQRRASLLKSFDVYSDVINAFSGRLNTILAIGGGGEGSGGGDKKANRFETVTIFEKPRKLAAGTTQSHIIKIPEYIGAVRVMVVAASDNAYGNEELLVPVKKELMVIGSLPRMLGVNEDINFPVSVFALDDRISNLKLSVKTTGPVQVVGENEQSFRVYDIGEIEKRFKLKTLSETGVGEIIVRAEAGNFEADYKINIDIRSPAPEITSFQDIMVKAGEKTRTYLTLPGIKGTNSMTLEVYQLPPINLAHRLGYLIRYPHGCIEQTTSGVFPQLYLNQLTKLSDEELTKIYQNVNQGIERIMLFQTSQGGFSYWPGKSDVNQWGTNYAGHFLIEAKTKGYDIPDSLYDGWLKYQKNAANAWTSSTKEEISTQAYRLFTLALAGEADLAAMNRLRASELGNYNTARLRLALAYSLSGQSSIAKTLVLSKNTDVPDYTELSGTFGNQLRDKAMILEALVGLSENFGTRTLAMDISNELSSDKSLNTQTTAYALIAMSKYGLSQEKRTDTHLQYRWGNTEGVVSTNRMIISQDIDINNLQSGTLEIENLGSGLIYPRILMRGVPAPGQEGELSQGLQLTVNYEDLDGRTVSLDDIELGMDLKITANVKNTGIRDYEEMILSQIVPSGWEIHNSRLSGNSSNKNYDYMDIRDDRVYTYFDISKGKTKTFTTLVNVSYGGQYYLPLTSCEAMYDPEIISVIKGRWLEVK